MKWKAQTLLIFTAFLLLSISFKAKAAELPVASGDCLIYVSETEEIGFQTIAIEYNFIFNMEVTSGTWNGTSGHLAMDSLRGTLSFHSEENTELRLYSDHDEELTVSGDGGTLTKTTVNDYTLSFLDGADVTITWMHPIPTYLNYTLFGIGMFGCGLIIVSPIWAVLKIKKDGFTDPDTLTRTFLAVLLMLIGYGLIIVWLYP